MDQDRTDYNQAPVNHDQPGESHWEGGAKSLSNDRGLGRGRLVAASESAVTVPLNVRVEICLFFRA